MSLSDYLHARPDRGEFSSIAQFAPPVPNLPSCINRRRQDVFLCYRALIEANQKAAPINVYAAQVRNAVLATAGDGRRASILRAADGTLFPELFAQAETALPLLDIPPLRRLTGATAVLTEITAGDNYYHWMMTSLPKLLLLMYRYPRLRFDHIVVNDGGTPYVRQTLDMLGVPPEIVVSTKDFPGLFIEDAYVASVRSDLLFPHELIVAMFRAVFPRALYRGWRLYVSRRGSRSVANEAELLPILEPLGFQIVRPEALTVPEQVRLFSQAQCVVSPHGAGMSNLVFAPPRTRILELFPPQQVSATFWFLANACGHQYHYLLGRGEDKPFDTGDWRSAERPDLTVDPEEFRQAVHALQLD